MIKAYIKSYLTGANRLLRNGHALVGRGRSCDINFDEFDNSVSRQHARIIVKEGTYFLHHDGTNCTCLNGERLHRGRSYKLTDGDTLQFGKLAYEFRIDVMPEPPPSNPTDELTHAIDSVLRAANTDSKPAAPTASRHAAGTIVGVTPRLLDTLRRAEVVGDWTDPVLITGETGTGKGLLARYIHDNSRRRSKPFEDLNAAALPETIIESLLFGTVEGAYTGAVNQAGLLEQANGGSVFLDEIGDYTHALQLKIMKVIEEKRFKRIGGRNTIEIDVKFIFATNKDLEKAVFEKTFREDLYYRINVHDLSLPSLRDRIEDLKALVSHIIERVRTDNPGIRAMSGRPLAAGITNPALRHLESYSWPGNIRQLENYIRRALVNATGDVLDIGELPPFPTMFGNTKVCDTQNLESLNVDAMIKLLASEAFERAKGVKSVAARMLGVSPATMGTWVDKFRLVYPRIQDAA